VSGFIKPLQTALLHAKFEDDLSRLERYLGADPCALVEAVENGQEGIDFCVKLFSESASYPQWDYVGQAVRRTLKYEDTPDVFDCLIAALYEIGISRVQMVSAPKDFDYAAANGIEFRGVIH
jgi:hypothetical protein